MKRSELKDFLDQKYVQYNNPKFIETDPIQLVRTFEKKEDQEIIGFLVATIAWGNRAAIIKSGERLIQLMGPSPFEFIQNYNDSRPDFVHRTFNALDLDFFFRSLKNIYAKGGLEASFQSIPDQHEMKGRIINFRSQFLATEHLSRSQKHISDPAKNSSCKRLNMFLRWMVRKDLQGVDLGIWNNIPISELMVPLDVHTGNVARKLGLITRNTNDWMALEELMGTLRSFDPDDPCKYDFALFGIGAFEKDFK